MEIKKHLLKMCNMQCMYVCILFGRIHIRLQIVI